MLPSLRVFESFRKSKVNQIKKILVRANKEIVWFHVSVNKVLGMHKL